VGFEIFNSNLNVNSLNSQIKTNRVCNSRKLYFTGTQAPDTFSSNSYEKLFTESQIRKMIAANPEITKILAENNIKLKLNIIELETLKSNHCQDVVKNSAAIAANLPPALKQKVNLKDLKEAALLHDFGKVLIPAEVLNKTSSLTKEERKIMNLHSELGYQLLKTTDVPKPVLNLVRYHHNNYTDSKDFIPDINLQILNLADKYSALTESRVYKIKYSPKQALAILYNEVEYGKIHPFLFTALVNMVNSRELTNSGAISN